MDTKVLPFVFILLLLFASIAFVMYGGIAIDTTTSILMLVAVLGGSILIMLSSRTANPPMASIGRVVYDQPPMPMPPDDIGFVQIIPEQPAMGNSQAAREMQALINELRSTVANTTSISAEEKRKYKVQLEALSRELRRDDSAIQKSSNAVARMGSGLGHLSGQLERLRAYLTKKKPILSQALQTSPQARINQFIQSNLAVPKKNRVSQTSPVVLKPVELVRSENNGAYALSKDQEDFLQMHSRFITFEMVNSEPTLDLSVVFEWVKGLDKEFIRNFAQSPNRGKIPINKSIAVRVNTREETIKNPTIVYINDRQGATMPISIESVLDANAVHQSIVCSGASGSGKSYMMRSMIRSLFADTQSNEYFTMQMHMSMLTFLGNAETELNDNSSRCALSVIAEKSQSGKMSMKFNVSLVDIENIQNMHAYALFKNEYRSNPTIDKFKKFVVNSQSFKNDFRNHVDKELLGADTSNKGTLTKKTLGAIKTAKETLESVLDNLNGDLRANWVNILTKFVEEANEKCMHIPLRDGVNFTNTITFVDMPGFEKLLKQNGSVQCMYNVSNEFMLSKYLKLMNFKSHNEADTVFRNVEKIIQQFKDARERQEVTIEHTAFGKITYNEVQKESKDAYLDFTEYIDKTALPDNDETRCVFVRCIKNWKKMSGVYKSYYDEKEFENQYTFLQLDPILRGVRHQLYIVKDESTLWWDVFLRAQRGTQLKNGLIRSLEDNEECSAPDFVLKTFESLASKPPPNKRVQFKVATTQP